ncbi:dosage compensation regulator [Dermatophagoides farinae]|uniref:RNA helicase n=1 Tax=Dermatophagoides farinae TaxID=6954 RepID=A0A9D4P2D7_DERFA|nr:ATP-dependent RNA helicase A protein-like isoform X2 [Dermatophagoides farinae]KAH7642753.1 dosage compensation regulator [Dermatophagoides farinae]
MDLTNTKAALNLWCSKKKLKIDYDVRVDNVANNQHTFHCDIKIQSINQIVGSGAGNNKKTASNIAALETLRYLIEQNYITEKEFSQQCFEILNVKHLLFTDSANKSVNFAAKNTQIQLQSSSKNNDKKTENVQNAKRSFRNNHNNGQNNRNPKHFSNYNHQPTHRFDAPRQPDYFNGPTQYSEHPSHGHFDGPPPPGHFNVPPSGYYNGPPSGHFDYPPSGPYDVQTPNHFAGPPPNGHFDGSPQGPYDFSLPPSHRPDNHHWYHNMPPPPSLPQHQDRPRFDDYHPPFQQYHRMPPPNRFHHEPRINPHSLRNSNQQRNRKLPLVRTPETSIDVNDLRMGNLEINDQHEINLNSSTRTTSNSEESLMNMVNDAKKRRSDPDSARNKIGLIHDECKFNLDNSKQQLNIFFQINRIKADYEFSSFGPPHLKTFVAKLKFFVYRNKKEYFAEERGNSKQDASRHCALNILHKLYKDNLIDSFDSEALSKRQLMKMSLIYVLNVKPELKDHLAQAYNYIQSYNHYAQQLQLINPTLNSEESAPKPENSFLYWCPPMENFNPWTNSNLDGTSFAGKTKQQINIELQNEFQTMIKSTKFQSVLQSRMKLPIWEHKEKVIHMIENNPVVIIKGSTGCGKTTQVSQFILDSYIKAANGANCNIIVTQPRRISAISIAERVAFERAEELKDGNYSVGYAVRFDHVYPRPYGSILFCTTGHLLRRIQGGLKGVSHLIIDEVHERDINTDLLLIIIRDLIKLDLNIHVIIMSATLGVSHFQNYFNCRNVMEIDSHVFPVRRYYLEDTIEMIKWRPKSLSYMEDDVEITEEIENSGQFEYPNKISQTTIDLLKELKEGVICFELIVALLEYINSLTITGSILIFLPGWNSIFNLLNYLQRHPIFGNESKFILIPLHSQLSHRDNNRIFLHSIQRKIILSTNIAETSITIDDVVFVIDTCLMKRKIYDSRTNCTSYIIDWVSQSNIQQRQGRAGRVRSGYFFVLCTKRRFNMLEEFKKPEILVSSLLETSLLIKHLGFGSVTAFLQRALDPPAPKAVEEALATLRIINAMDTKNELTALGTILAKMPIDPRIGRMVIESILLNVASPIVTIAAASSINYEMFDNSDLNLLLQTLLQLDEERFSDHLITFKVFSMCDKNDTLNTKSNAYRCINLNSITVVRNARRQLVSILTKCGFNEDLFTIKQSYLYTTAEFDIIAGLLVTAFYPNVCIHKDTRRILTNEERIGLIHKTSVFYSYVNNQKLSRSTNLRSPVFIYSEKSQNKNLISSKQMTMVTFLQLLLFGIKSFEFPPNIDGVNTVADTVLLDGWIEIKIDPELFDYIWQIKTEFEQLLTRVCKNPDYAKNELDTTVLNSVAAICLFQNIEVNIIGK